MKANYPAKDQEYYNESLDNEGYYEQTVNFELNGFYSAHLFMFTPNCVIMVVDTVEITTAQYAINCSGTLSMELMNENLGIYEAQWQAVSFDVNLPESYEFVEEHEIYFLR